MASTKNNLVSSHASNIISFNEPLKTFVFEQIHLDIARNATDDFNLFHNKNQWHNITNNPFNGPIILGFQLEALIEDQVKKKRSGENIKPNKLTYSNYQFNFAGAIKPNEPFELTVKKTRQDTNSISNRICIKSKRRLVISGLKKDSSKPIYLANEDFSTLKDISTFDDKSLVLKDQYFLKKKYITTSNAKNYLIGSLVEQSDYIDEIDDKVSFPEMFPCSFISCALLEKARLEGLNFSKHPSVYTQHKISINKLLIECLKSNDPLYILIQNEPFKKTTVLNCFGLNRDNKVIFSAIISLSEIQPS